jgi:WD40 repeat protein
VLLDNSQAREPAWFAALPQLAGGGKSHLLMSAVVTRGNHVLSADFGGRVWLLDTSGSIHAIEMEEAGGPIWSLALSPDDKTLAAAGYRSNTVMMWDVATRKKRLTLVGHTDRVWTVAFAPDGRTIASGANDKTVRVWDVVTGSQVRKIDVPAEWIYALTIAPDSQTLAIGAGDNRVRLYDIATGREHDPLGQHPATVRAAAFFPNGRTLATGSDDGTVKLWDLATRQERITLRVPPLPQISKLADGTTTADMLDSSVWSIAIAPDGQALAAGDGDGRITIWRAAAKVDSGSAASRP